MFLGSPYAFTPGLNYQPAQFAGSQFGSPVMQSQLSSLNQKGTDNIILVQGEDSARSIQLPPNSRLLLMDNDEALFYIKTTDASGMATIKTYVFQEFVKEDKTSNLAENFVSRDEFLNLKSAVEGLLASPSLTPKKGGQNNESDIEVIEPKGFAQF